ncbi:MAG: PAS-domain containing protein [Pseudomonadota bacterium]
MQNFDVVMALLVVGSAVACACAGLLILVRMPAPRRISWTPFERSGEAIAFLFEDEELVDATPEAKRLMSLGPEQMDEWQRLMAALSPRFPDLGAQLSDLGQRLRVELPSTSGEHRLTAEWRAGLTRIQLDDLTHDGSRAHDGIALDALNDELADLRATVDSAPLLVWKEDQAGAVRWANSAYIERALARDPDSETLSWPLPQLFPDAPWRQEEGTSPDDPVRLTLDCPSDLGPLTVRDTHFTAFRTRAQDGQMVFALPADALERAQASRREFIQTLTKTFAHLPIGLAVFDRNRRLAMFNPALTDLTELQPLFLSRRPTLFDFLDQLREARRMPEPKDYRDWRRKISDLEHASSNGTHIETWALPDGQTFRVTGRPHPDGAIAFLIEDITSEISLSRRFRSELELGQAVVDSLDEAIAVFSASRDLILSNASYDALWGTIPDTLMAPRTLAEASDQWREAAQPSPLWDRLMTRTGTPEDRVPWSGLLRRNDGRGLHVRVVPLAGNALLVGFSNQPVSKATLAPEVPSPQDSDVADRLPDTAEAVPPVPKPARHG